MKWDLGDERDVRVVEYDGWLDLIDIEAPDGQGVFVFVSKKLEVVYIGCAQNSLIQEMKEAVSAGKSSGASMYSWYVTDSTKSSISLHTDWINKYKPGAGF